MKPAKGALTGRMAEFFINSKLTPLIIVVTVVMGVMAIAATPKEDDPTINVVAAAVQVSYPGHGAAVVDERVARPVASWIRQIDTVKHVTSSANDDGVILMVEFKDGVAREAALTQLYDRIQANLDQLPSGASTPTVKLRSSDDIPCLAVSLWTKNQDPQVLRKLAAELAAELRNLPNVAKVDLIGGQTRAFLVELDTRRLSERGIATDQVIKAIQSANLRLPAGAVSGPQGYYRLEAGAFLNSAAEASLIMVGTNAAGPIYLRDVATVRDGFPAPEAYVARLAKDTGWSSAPAVTLTVTKVRGSNVTRVSRSAKTVIERFQKKVLPSDIRLSVSRDQGRTAEVTLNNLTKHMLISLAVAVLLVLFALGWREGLVTAVTLLVTLIIVPIVYRLTGFTLNRISMSAMVFAIGLLIDNSIVIIENIDRHWHSGEAKNAQVAAQAVQEVGPPTILATIMVVCALVPTAFVSGAIGQYLRPLPIGASLGMLFSLFVAISVTPYLYYHLLSTRRARLKYANSQPANEAGPSALMSWYLGVIAWLMQNKYRIFAVYALAFLLFAAVVAMIPARVVAVRNMPDQDADEVSIMIDLPPATQLEDTYARAVAVADRLQRIPEVQACNLYVGTPAPVTALGLARNHDFRYQPYQAEVQAQLSPDAERRRKSHAIALEMRALVAPVLKDKGSVFSVAEVPAGPPTLAPLVAEVYAPSEAERQALALAVMRLFQASPGVEDIDATDRAGSERLRYTVDIQKASLRGVAAASAASTVRTLFAGDASAWVNLASDREPVPILIRLSRQQRVSADDLISLNFNSLLGGEPVPAGDIGTIERLPGSYPLMRMDLQPVIMVTGNATGLEAVPCAQDISKQLAGLQVSGAPVEVIWSEDYPSAGQQAVRWAGDWTQERDMYSDLGLAFLAVLFLIYCLLVGWYRSFLVPIIIMLPIPLVFIGVIPAHFLFDKPLSGTATMGAIALAGIVIRNSILLVDFSRSHILAGMSRSEAVIKACEMRSRPIVLTALAVILGESVLYFDPILLGIGLTLPAGALVSTVLTLGIVPLAYYQLSTLFHKHGRELE